MKHEENKKQPRMGNHTTDACHRLASAGTKPNQSEIREQAVLLFGSANTATYNGYSLNLVAAPQIGCWRPQLAVYVSLSPTDARNLGIEVYRKQPYFLFEWDNSFQFPNGWFLNIQADYHPVCHSGFAVFHTTGQVNARVSKSFLKDNAMTVTLTTTRNGCLNRLKHLKVEEAHIEAIILVTQADVDNGYGEHEALLQKAETIARSLKWQTERLSSPTNRHKPTCGTPICLECRK